MRNGARTVLVLCALAVGVVPLPLGSNGIAVAWAFLGVVFGATFAPTLWRRYGISHRPLQAITGTSLALVGGVAGWALAIASALFVYSLVVAVGGFFLWIPVGLLAGVLTLPRLQSTGTGVVPPSKTVNSASSQRDRSTVHLVLSVTAAGVWSIPTAVSIMWVGESLYGDMFIEALGGLLAQIFFVFSDASAFSSPNGVIAVFTAVAIGSAIAGLGFFVCVMSILGIERLLYRAGTTSPTVRFTHTFASTAMGIGTYLLTGYVIWVSLAGCGLGVILIAATSTPAIQFV